MSRTETAPDDGSQLSTRAQKDDTLRRTLETDRTLYNKQQPSKSKALCRLAGYLRSAGVEGELGGAPALGPKLPAGT